jgi:hypothetical protein
LKKLLLTIFLAHCWLGLQAQVEWESQVWTSAEFQYNLKGPWSFGFSPEVRFRTSPLMARTIFPDLYAGYKISKRISFGLHYRYVYNNEGMGNYYFKHSVLGEVTYKVKRDKFQFGFRLRTGTVEDETPDPELLQTQSWEVREKFSVSYRVKKKLEAYVNCEFFQWPVEGWNELQQLRLAGGAEISLSKSQRLQLGLMFQGRPDVKRFNPLISYSLDLDKLKDKKK